MESFSSWSDLFCIDAQRYRTEGATVARQVFPPDTLNELRSGWQGLRAQIADGSVKRNARFVSGCLPAPFGLLYRQDCLVNLARALLATEDIALYMNRLLLKDEHWSGAVAIHQDMPYFSGGLIKLSVFVPLVPISSRGGNGGLIFIKGSHKYGNLQRGTIRRENFPQMDELAPDLEVGDAVLMDFLTWHYSEQATASTDRPILQIVYQPSTDGSYGTAELGVPHPTLVSGDWKTQYFAAWGNSTIPDA